jgi:hypothetical protein
MCFLSATSHIWRKVIEVRFHALMIRDITNNNIFIRGTALGVEESLSCLADIYSSFKYREVFTVNNPFKMNAFYHAEKEFNCMGLEGGVSFDVYPAMMVIQPKVSSSGVSKMHFPRCARVTWIAASDKTLLEYDRELTRLDVEFCHETLVSQSDLIRVCGDGRGVREALPRGYYVGFYIKRWYAHTARE